MTLKDWENGNVAKGKTYNSWILKYGLLKNRSNLSLPGQGTWLQDRLSRAVPKQDFPPYLGGGFVQLLERSWEPVPHGMLQELHLLQLDQPPFTEISMIKE